ncbi:DNA cytosine methyltransferase (plasmid) [Pseudomonas alloputida]|uniref:DNA cytosine methyltransferase n=1 Tax=Pseudomonas alloputida TaxID=1940621 RepID=UPI003B4344DE
MTTALGGAALSAISNAIHTVHFNTQYQLPLTAQDDEIIVDYFCGGGGGSTGLEEGLGRTVAIAKNHDSAAISLHERNHPHALHLQTDVFSGDPREETGGRRVGWFHMSPDCTHHSQAAGGQPRKKATRDLAWVGCKWAGTVRPRLLSAENVRALTKWGPLVAKRCKHTGRVVKLDGTVAQPGERVPVQEQYLIPDTGLNFGNKLKRRSRKRKFTKHGMPESRSWDKFIRHLRGLGYVVEWRTLKACDYGAPTIRDRLFIIARCDGRPIVWPEPTHAENPEPWQEPWLQGHQCIDWSIVGQSIWGRKKPLADATLRRIARGTFKYVLDCADPFIVPIANWSSRDAVQSVREPLRTVTAWPKGGSFALASPVFAPLTHQGGDRTYSPRAPLPTVTAANRGELALFSAFLAQANGGYNTTVGHDLRRPVSAITQTGSQQQLVAASLATLRRNCVGRDLRDPLPVVTAGGEHHALVEYDLSPSDEQGALRVAAFLMQYYSEGGQWGSLDKPLNTVTTKDRLALVTVYLSGEPYVIVDIRLRMLQPHELYRAQGFPANYVIDTGHDGRKLTKTEQVRMCGNSVPPPVMAAIARANDPWAYAEDQAEAA